MQNTISPKTESFQNKIAFISLFFYYTFLLDLIAQFFQSDSLFKLQELCTTYLHVVFKPICEW